MTAAHVLGFAAALAITLLPGLWAGRHVKTAGAFSGGARSSGPVLIAGVILGTIVGGSSTVGTAQLAFHYGLSAWWYTLGGAIACLFLAWPFAGSLRRLGGDTLVGVIAREYGRGTGLLVSCMNSVGMFLNIVSQLLSATAVLAVILPGMGAGWALALSAALMAAYVLTGGLRGTGIIGTVKLALLYVAMVSAGALALSLCGGFGSFLTMARSLEPRDVRYLSLLARGPGTDLGAALSLVLGVLSTQTYAQAVMSARSDAAARKGALISALLMPPIGACGILVGLYMRSQYPAMDAKSALTAFVMEHMPPALAGLILGTLLVAVVGTGAGLALGIGTVVDRDIVHSLSRRELTSRQDLRIIRGSILVLLALACLVSGASMGGVILDFAFVSMALRGAVVFVPLCFALWLPGRISGRWAMAAAALGPGTVFACRLLFPALPFDPLFAGVGLSLAVMLLGLLKGPRRP